MWITGSFRNFVKPALVYSETAPSRSGFHLNRPVFRLKNRIGQALHHDQCEMENFTNPTSELPKLFEHLESVITIGQVKC